MAAPAMAASAAPFDADQVYAHMSELFEKDRQAAQGASFNRLFVPNLTLLGGVEEQDDLVRGVQEFLEAMERSMQHAQHEQYTLIVQKIEEILATQERCSTPFFTLVFYLPFADQIESKIQSVTATIQQVIDLTMQD